MNASPVTSGQSPVLEIKNLTKKYGSFTSLDGLTMSVNAGQILGLIGPNGAGKTTTIKILVGLIKPTSGSAIIDGVDCVRDARHIKRLVGFMPDTFGSYDNMSVREYLSFFAAIFGIPSKRRSKRVDEVMEMTGTAYMRDRYVDALSHGMKQRVGLSRILLHDPKVLILDEPVNGLDPQARIEMRDLLIALARQGKTLLVTSHILPELARICHQVAILARGKLRAFGTVEEIGRQVSQKRTMEACLVSVAQVPLAAKIMRQSLEPTAEVIEDNEEVTVRFRTSKSEAALGILLGRLVQFGVKVVQYRELQTDLEEAFMSFARPDEQAQEQSLDVVGAARNV